MSIYSLIGKCDMLHCIWSKIAAGFLHQKQNRLPNKNTLFYVHILKSKNTGKLASLGDL